MNFLRHQADIDRIVPGVSQVYKNLRSSNGQGLYTSLGRYYNNTIFGRDAGMTAKFVTHFDHDTAWQTILTLASYQGQKYDRQTMEAPGKIHHEMRDYSQWQGCWYDRLGLELAGRAWGKKNRKLVTYFAADSTATYIRLVNKYSRLIDKSIIDRQVPSQDGHTISLGESVAKAANWIADQIDETGIFWIERSNRWSLPYQTFADSVTAYAWSDGSAANAAKKHSYIEVQVYALDALRDAIRLLPAHANRQLWRNATKRAQAALFDEFWAHSRVTFSPAVFMKDGVRRQLDGDMITAAWALNASFWDDLPEDVLRSKVESIVERIFQPSFLTDYGIRTKPVGSPEPLGDIIDYHGSQTIWPMFNFMVIEGLRRHKLYRLARQIEFRLINTMNAVKNFEEFFIVDEKDSLYRPTSAAKLTRSGQMIPENNIAFTAVPALTLAYRHMYRRTTPQQHGWRYEFEERLLSTTPNVELLEPEVAESRIEVKPLKIKRTVAGLKSAQHILTVILGNND